MVRVAWVTDIHLNFVEGPGRRQFFQALAAAAPDGVVVSGDIAESDTLDQHLLEMAAAIARPIYFVLGNHDFYRGSIAETRARAERLRERSPLLVYLTGAGVVELTPHTALVGHDGWADARLGDFAHSDVILNDYLLIEELYHWKNIFVLDRDALRERLRQLGDEAAAYFEATLPAAFQTHRRVVAVTHVPPFRETCWHGQELSDDNWLPHFSSRAVGEAFCRVMQSHPDRQLLVLCGHTHSPCDVAIHENLQVLAGGAEYGHPSVQRIFEFE